MPIYAYRCAACGHARDVLQKISDPLLTVCPACGAEAFQKQVTAAGFQLKGSGWYVTDFRGGNAGKAGSATTETAPAETAAKSDKPADTSAAAPAPASTSTPSANS
ncbi:MAG: zinc ribbon domain-containing protein [Rubrivivax sp.]